MGVNDKVRAYKQRWGSSDSDSKELADLKTRILSMLGTGFFVLLTSGQRLHRAFCHVLALPFEQSFDEFADREHMSVLRRDFEKEFRSASTPARTALVLQALIIALESTNDVPNQEALKKLQSAIHSASELTPRVGMRVVETDGSRALYPHGAEALDAELVNRVVAWLADVPAAAKAYSALLELLWSGSLETRRNVVDNLRVAVEAVLRKLLKNEKSLENQQDALTSWLKERGAHQQTINLFVQVLFGPYRIFQNEAVKHGDDFIEPEVEFQIYQTGTLLRMLLRLEQSYQEG